MNDENVTGKLAGALAKAQAAFPAIPRDRTVTVRMKTGGSYTFAYAPLDTVLAAVRGPLAANGLAVSQLLDGGDLVTLLLHESGESLSGRWTLPPHQDIQGLGSAVTYLRRYALQALLGIASEEDDDGNASAGHHATPRQDVDRETGEIRRPPVQNAPAARVAPPGPSAQDIAGLHQQFASPADVSTGWTPEELDSDGGITHAGMTTPELFAAAEKADISKAQITMGAKLLFGASRWKVTDLTDEERGSLWESLA